MDGKGLRDLALVGAQIKRRDCRVSERWVDNRLRRPDYKLRRWKPPSTLSTWPVE
jgi:hypothetical protein